MAIYWGRFVPSVINGTSAGDWEMFRNAENPARELKARARDRRGKFFLPPLPGHRKVYPIPTKLLAFNDADQSAMMLIWQSRDMPSLDEAPDEVWHLTDRYGLIRTLWSTVVEPASSEPIEVQPARDTRATQEALVEPFDDFLDLEIYDEVDEVEVTDKPRIDNRETEEYSVVDIQATEPEALWRPPTLDELAERKVILVGDKRPLVAGAYSERAVENFNPTGLRKPCPECGVVPHVKTYKCRCR